MAISVYLLSCIGLSLNNIVDVLVLVFLMALVGYIYITNDLSQPNALYDGVKSLQCETLCRGYGETMEGIIVCKNCVDMGIEKRLEVGENIARSSRIEIGKQDDKYIAI